MSQSPISPTTRTHPDYYMPGGDVLILVQKPTPTYFRISSWFLQGSDFLKIKAAPDTAQAEPLPEMERAIVVDEHEATVEQMALICWVWLNPLFDDYTKATLADWFTILRLAQLWSIPSVKAMALRYIQPRIERDIPGLVNRIQKYEEYSAPAEVLLPLYVELCRRDGALSDEEWDVLEKLPEARIRRVVRARETIARKKGSTGSLPQAELEKLEKYVAKTIDLVVNLAPASSNAASTNSDSGTSTSGTSGAGGEQTNSGGRAGGGGGGSSNRGGRRADGPTRPRAPQAT